MRLRRTVTTVAAALLLLGANVSPAAAADGWTNDWAAVVHVQTNYGKDRYCQALPSAQGWGTCNYNHEEGKCVRFRLYELKDGVVRNMSDYSRWYGTEYGSPC